MNDEPTIEIVPYPPSPPEAAIDKIIELRKARGFDFDILSEEAKEKVRSHLRISLRMSVWLTHGLGLTLSPDQRGNTAG